MAFLVVPALAGDQINVTFKNRSGYDVAFYLNGGDGLETTLADGSSQSYSVEVDPGVEPIVRIHQPEGDDLDFWIEDGGSYVFRMQNGRIVNDYDE